MMYKTNYKVSELSYLDWWWRNVCIFYYYKEKMETVTLDMMDEDEEEEFEEGDYYEDEDDEGDESEEDEESEEEEESEEGEGEEDGSEGDEGIEDNYEELSEEQGKSIEVCEEDDEEENLLQEQSIQDGESEDDEEGNILQDEESSVCELEMAEAEEQEEEGEEEGECDVDDDDGIEEVETTEETTPGTNDSSIDSKADLARDSSTTTDDTQSTVRRQSPYLTQDVNNMETLSPLHQEMLDHQIKNDYDFGDTQVENKLYGDVLPEECIKSDDAVMIDTVSDISISTQINDPSPDLPRINKLPRDRDADDSFYQSFASPSVFETLDADDSPPSTPRSKHSPSFGKIRNLLNELSVKDDEEEPAMQSCLGEEFLSHELEDAMQDTTAPFQSITSFSTVNTSTPKPRPKPIIHESIRAQNITLDYAGNPMVYDEAVSINLPYQEDYNPDATSSLDNDRGSVGHIESRLTKIKNQEVTEAEQKEKEKMQKELQRMKALIENYKEVKLDLETKCESYDSEVERLQMKCVELEKNAKQNDMKSVIAAKDTMIGELNVKADSYESEMNRLNMEVIRLSKTMEEEKSKAHQEKNDLHTAHQLEVHRYKEKIKHMDKTEELEDLKKLVQGYRDGQVEYDAKCESFKTETDRLTSKCSDLEKLVAELQNTNGELKESLVKKEESAETEKDKLIVELNQKSSTSEMEMENLKKELQASNEVIASLKSTKVELETKCGEFESEVNQLNQRCQDLEKQHGEVSKDTSKDASKLKAYKAEITRLDGELLKMNETLASYKEQKSLMESKCVAYDNQITALNEKCACLEKASSNDTHDIVNDTIEIKNQIIGDMKVKAESYESELNRLQQEVNNLMELNEEYKNIKHVLESKCESFEKEIESLKENHSNYEQHQKVNDVVKACHELDRKCKELQLANQKLLDDYNGLEGAKHVYEEEVQAESARYEKQIRELTEEKIRLLSMTKPEGKYSDNHARMNINRLKSENKVLKEKLNLIRNESELHDSTTSKENISPHHVNGYKPPVVPISKPTIDPDILNTSHTRSSRSHRHKHTISNEDYTLPSRYNAHRYSSSPDAYDKTDFVPQHVVADNNLNHSYSKKNHLDDVMRRYSSPIHMDHNATAPPAEVHHTSRSRNPSSSFHDTSLSYLDCNSYLGSSKFSSRSRSMDHLDSSGTEDATFYSAKSLVTIPFCPTSIKELTVGMKISVNRANGRLSRGTVRWIGTLPRQTGDYVGVELTSEIGKHDGTLHGVQYFKCQNNRGIFVKFKKVIMAWR